ncbi:MAG: hypothetical protein AAF546_13855 [Verrucomicrobiota bacterium]
MKLPAACGGEFHYFLQFIKVETRYRIPRKELDWPSEYPASLGKSEFAGDELIRIVKNEQRQQ